MKRLQVNKGLYLAIALCGFGSNAYTSCCCSWVEDRMDACQQENAARIARLEASAIEVETVLNQNIPVLTESFFKQKRAYAAANRRAQQKEAKTCAHVCGMLVGAVVFATMWLLPSYL